MVERSYVIELIWTSCSC